jgi:hypothetical protein
MPHGAQLKARSYSKINNMANPTTHSPVEVVANDDWTLTDTNGQPLDLTDAVLELVLIDGQGARVASFPGLAEITVVEDAPGVVIITLAADATDLPPGGYATIHGKSDTMRRGPVLVDARPPWAPAPPPPILSAGSTVVRSPTIGVPDLLSPGVDQLG